MAWKRECIFYIKGEPEEIIDPDTNEALGEVAHINVVVRADEVAANFCIARTFRTRRIKVSEALEGGPLYGSVSASLNPLAKSFQPLRQAQYEVRVETLRLDPKKGQPINPSDSIVKVGDLAESVQPDKDINPVTTTLFR